MVPTSASTRCRQPPNAKPTGSLVFPVFLQLLQVLAAFDAQLFELPIDLHHVGMLLGVGQQQLGPLDAQFDLFFVEAGEVGVRFNMWFGAGADGGTG